MNKYTHQFCVNKTHMYKIIQISNQCLHLMFNVSLLVLKQPFNRLGGNERAELARGTLRKWMCKILSFHSIIITLTVTFFWERIFLSAWKKHSIQTISSRNKCIKQAIQMNSERMVFCSADFNGNVLKFISIKITNTPDTQRSSNLPISVCMSILFFESGKKYLIWLFFFNLKTFFLSILPN